MQKNIRLEKGFRDDPTSLRKFLVLLFLLVTLVLFLCFN